MSLFRDLTACGAPEPTPSPLRGERVNVQTSLLVMWTLLACTIPLLGAESVTIKSPDGKVRVLIQPGEHLTYSVAFKGHLVLETSGLGIRVDGNDLGRNTAIPSKPETKE